MLCSVVTSEPTEITECLVEREGCTRVLIFSEYGDLGCDECAQSGEDIPCHGHIRVASYRRRIADVGNGGAHPAPTYG